MPQDIIEFVAKNPLIVDRVSKTIDPANTVPIARILKISWNR